MRVRNMLSEGARQRLNAWWQHEELDRPCILAYLHGQRTPIIAPPADEYWTKPELLAAHVVRQAEQLTYLGEAAPYLYIDYGACAMALQLGAHGKWDSRETIWTSPCAATAAEVAHLTPGGRWKDIQDRAIARALELNDGRALLASYCLGASADTTAALMGTENLLCALLDEPQAVHEAFESVKRITIAQFNSLAAQCAAAGCLLSGWHGIWAPGASTPIQEDFSYMIGVDMFDEFCLPHIRDMVDAVPYSFYHLDGVQALRHLPSLCAIPGLRAIQWQPGAGHSDIMQWTDEIRYILASGKSCQVYVRAAEVEELIRSVGATGMLLIVSGSDAELEALADRYGLERNLLAARQTI